MKPSKFILVLLLLELPFLACKSDQEDNTMAFLNYIKSEDYDKAKSLLNSGNERTLGADGVNWRLKNAHELLAKYGMPPQSKWEIKYDTGRENGIFRMIEITIPVYRASEPISRGDLTEGVIELAYIYKMPFFGDSIFSFDTHLNRKH